ncbi:hypothetical protein A8L34_25920 [Bacillus sp. FJAT-27264]|uniref:hypothetical protein n=1 Tax=Paenibacillus sp. (strain DSM 101736 / FJAT-27264) TaxID=1850362 RepID=UPI000808001B|nr:hypothetical protein [Bacillus sp. FJAT-27264]OBZ07573.1 hypothetical protein A8L34_25920 [Bacillus sp. FJAT-27264]
MFTINYDEKKNRLYLKIYSVTKDNVQQYVDELTENLEKTKPGFTAIGDLSDAKVLSQDVAQELSTSNELVVKYGLSTEKSWASVTTSSIYRMQMKRMFGGFIKFFDTVEDAHAYLDAPEN